MIRSVRNTDAVAPEFDELSQPPNEAACIAIVTRGHDETVPTLHPLSPQSIEKLPIKARRTTAAHWPCSKIPAQPH